MKDHERNSFLAALTKSPVDLANSVTKVQLLAVCDYLIKDLATVYTSVKTLRQFSGRALTAKLASNEDFQRAIVPITSRVHPRVRSQLSDDIFSSVEQTANAQISVLRAVKAELENSQTPAKIVLSGITTKGIMILGALRQSICVGACYRSLLALATSSVTQTKTYPIHANRLAKCAETYAHAWSDTVSKRGAVKFADLAKSVKSSAMDVPIMDTKGEFNFVALDAVPNQGSLCSAGIAGLPFFKDIGFAWNVMVKKTDSLLAREQRWMQAHSAMLAAAVAGMSESDPEYIEAMEQIRKLEDVSNLVAKLREWIY